MGTSPDSHFYPFSSDHIGQEIFEDSDSERVYGDSVEEEASSYDSLDSLISNVGGGINVQLRLG